MRNIVVSCVIFIDDALYISDHEMYTKRTGRPHVQLEIQEHDFLGRVEIAAIILDCEGLGVLINRLTQKYAEMNREEIGL